MGISSDLQRVVVARLRAAVPEVAGRVYDGPSESAQLPYLSIGPSYWSDASAECIRGRAETLQIDIWASARPDLRLCKDVTDAVAEALEGWTDTDTLPMHGLRVVLARVMRDPDGVTAHGVVQVEAMVEAH